MCFSILTVGSTAFLTSTIKALQPYTLSLKKQQPIVNKMVVVPLQIITIHSSLKTAASRTSIKRTATISTSIKRAINRLQNKIVVQQKSHKPCLKTVAFCFFIKKIAILFTFITESSNVRTVIKENCYQLHFHKKNFSQSHFQKKQLQLFIILHETLQKKLFVFFMKVLSFHKSFQKKT